MIVGLAGCGASKGSTAAPSGARFSKAEVLQRGDAICVRRQRQGRRNKPPASLNNPSAGQLKRIGPFLQRAAAAGSNALAKLRALGPPKTDREGFDIAISTGQQFAADEAAAARAAMSGDLPAYNRALTNLNGSAVATQTATAGFGFKHCGQGR